MPPNAALRLPVRHGRGGTWLSVVPVGRALSPEGEALVDGRARRRRARSPVLVGGPVGRSSSTRRRRSSAACRWRAALIALATFVLLFLMFGSLLVPAKARRAQPAQPHRDVRRHGVDLPGGPPVAASSTSPPTGMLDTTTPILMFCIAFGLSMDYEVFLLSPHQGGARPRRATTSPSVAVGLERTGRIVDRGGRAARRRVHRLRHLGHHLHQALRHRPGAGRAHGRHPDPRHAGAGVHAAGRRRQLVGAGAAAPHLRALRASTRSPTTGSAVVRSSTSPRATSRSCCELADAAGSEEELHALLEVEGIIKRRPRHLAPAGRELVIATRSKPRPRSPQGRGRPAAAGDPRQDRAAAGQDRRRGGGVDPRRRQRRRCHAAVDLPALRRQGRADPRRVRAHVPRPRPTSSRSRVAGIADPLEQLAERGRAYVRLRRRASRALPRAVHGQGARQAATKVLEAVGLHPPARQRDPAWTPADRPRDPAVVSPACGRWCTASRRWRWRVPGCPVDRHALIEHLLDVYGRGWQAPSAWPPRSLTETEVEHSAGRRCPSPIWRRSARTGSRT